MPKKSRTQRKLDGLQRPQSAFLKPKRFKHYLTIGELAVEVGKSPEWIRRLERAGRLPIPTRHVIGELEVRLYSPGHVTEIRAIFADMRVGRPKAKEVGHGA